MNFQSVNAAKKDGTDAGYSDSIGTPDANLEAALTYVDQNIGSFVSALAAADLTESTAVIVMAKHGESPKDYLFCFKMKLVLFPKNGGVIQLSNFVLRGDRFRRRFAENSAEAFAGVVRLLERPSTG